MDWASRLGGFARPHRTHGMDRPGRRGIDGNRAYGTDRLDWPARGCLDRHGPYRAHGMDRPEWLTGTDRPNRLHGAGGRRRRHQYQH
jgi:hypothetical protein